MLGVGGALTDAAAETFYKLPADKQQEILTAYFDPQKGIGYSLGRTSIHSCDFSSESYTYVTNDDATLASFNIESRFEISHPFYQGTCWQPPAKTSPFLPVRGVRRRG